jgi:hypothetical protein
MRAGSISGGPRTHGIQGENRIWFQVVRCCVSVCYSENVRSQSFGLDCTAQRLGTNGPFLMVYLFCIGTIGDVVTNQMASQAF